MLPLLPLFSSFGLCLPSTPRKFPLFHPTSFCADNRDPRVGIGFILLSCLVQGTQYVFEEKVRKEREREGRRGRFSSRQVEDTGRMGNKEVETVGCLTFCRSVLTVDLRRL